MIGSHKKTIYEALGRESIHPFPARMAPGIALEILNKSPGKIRVLDPMMGSGTVVAMARSRGHHAIGIDIDPLAVLMTRTWATAYPKSRALEEAEKTLHRAHKIFNSLQVRDAYPQYADQETKKFVSYWFDGYARRQLTSLAQAIRLVRDDSIRNALWCGFSRLIITKQAGASLAMDLAHSRPHKVYSYAPTKPFSKFLSAVDRVVQNSLDANEPARGPAPNIKLGDARFLPTRSNSIDLVLTSPPYLNAIDYIRCSKFSLVWMGYKIKDLRQLRAGSVGAEAGAPDSTNGRVREVISQLALRPKLSGRSEAVLTRYVFDMQQTINEVSRVLKPGGQAVYVVGENTVRGTYIQNSKIVTALAEQSGLTFIERRARLLPQNRRYLPPPATNGNTDSMNGRMRREIVLAFRK